MKNNLIVLIVNLLWAVTLLGCQQKSAFSPGQCYRVEQLLDSKEAKVACDEKASFEGSTLCLTGVLEVSNDPRPMPRNFFLQIPGDLNRAVEVQFDEDVAVKIVPQVQANRGKPAQLIGTVTGFGHPGNPDCHRTFILRLSNVADFRLE